MALPELVHLVVSKPSIAEVYRLPWEVVAVAAERR
jgi:hypothetical protein